jgi:DNA-binding response OmpR family regulator
LVARVKALARRKKHVVNKILQLGDLKLDYNSYSVYRKDKPITLTSKEYTLLEYFMLHPNKILSKEQIISYVWNYDADVLLNTVEVYIKNLRGKIGNEYIKTARGFGYKLDIKN